MIKIFNKIAIATVLAISVSATVKAQSVNMNNYITLTVDSGENITLSFAASESIAVKIESGTATYNVSVGNDLTEETPYMSASTTMTIYGDIKGFNCSNNGTLLKAVDASNNPILEALSCANNSVASLNVSGCLNLTKLICTSNKIINLDVSGNTQLQELYCERNSISTLNLSGNTALRTLYCGYNRLDSINVSNNTELRTLACRNNSLTSIDVSNNHELRTLSFMENIITSVNISNNPNLTVLMCYGNPITTQALDDIYCSLPRTTVPMAAVYPRYEPSYEGTPSAADVAASNISNARSKGWWVLYSKDYSEITSNGTYVCPTSDIVEVVAETDIKIYPNPATTVITLITDENIRNIRIYNTLGVEVVEATDTNTADIGHIPAGVYMVKITTDRGVVSKPIVKQ